MKKTVRLDSREQRRILATRDTPYYVDVAKGVAIGYRKGTTGGAWSLRIWNGSKYHKSQVGLADDDLAVPADGVRVFAWKDMVKKAVAEPAKADVFRARYSVAECVADYFTSRNARSRSAESIRTDEGKAQGFIQKFGSTQVTDLTTATLQAWRDRMVTRQPADSLMTEAERREAIRAAQATANRIWTICKAALNSAFNTGIVDSDLAWRRVKPFKNVDEPRKRFLSVAEANRLLGASTGHFRNLAEAALLSGLRPGELVRLTVGQFKDSRLQVAAGKDKSRVVPLNKQGDAFFKGIAKNRAAGDLMLPSPNGGEWRRIQISRAMRTACEAAGLETAAVFYDLRRTYGSLLANAGSGDAMIATMLGHADTRMTRRHYAHLLDGTVAAELQARLPEFKATPTGSVEKA